MNSVDTDDDLTADDLAALAELDAQMDAENEADEQALEQEEKDFLEQMDLADRLIDDGLGHLANFFLVPVEDFGKKSFEEIIGRPDFSNEADEY